jgi:hypothetical protein
MKRVDVEKKIAVALFILVLITFSFAQRDSKRYNQTVSTVEAKSNMAQNAAGKSSTERY